MTKEKLKITYFIIGIIISAISTWNNRYGEVELWGFHHQISMAVSTIIAGLLMRISFKPDYKFGGLFLSIGVISIPIFIIIRSTLYNHPTDLSFFTVIYILVAFFTAYTGSYAGELLLKDEFRESS